MALRCWLALRFPAGPLHTLCHQGCSGSASLQVTPGHHFLCRSSQIPIHEHGCNVHSLQNLKYMVRACSTRFIFNAASLSLGITRMETLSCGLLGNIPAFGQSLESGSPFAVRRENWNHIHRMYNLYFCFLCVSLQSEAEHQRNADAPVARYEPTANGAAQPFPRSCGLAAEVESQAGLSCSARFGDQLLGGSWLFFT